jgi:DNA-binding transcriptional LysR family regulator
MRGTASPYPHTVARLKAHRDIAEDLRTGRLVELLAPYACDELNLYAAYPSRQFLPPRTRVFIDFMVNSLGDSVRRARG